MKRVCAAVLMLALMTGLVAYAEQPRTITFRDIPWLESMSEVKPKLAELGFKSSWYMPIEEGARIDTWHNPSRYVYGEPSVENGGVILQYDDVEVAGYFAELELSFMYPVIGCEVKRDLDSAIFYSAEYQIEDLEDMEGAYSGLLEKLTQLYGEPKDGSEYDSRNNRNYLQGAIWTAENGSLVWLAMTYSPSADKYDELRIVYAAPNVDELLIELDKQIKFETSKVEALERDRNVDNFNGL